VHHTCRMFSHVNMLTKIIIRKLWLKIFVNFFVIFNYFFPIVLYNILLLKKKVKWNILLKKLYNILFTNTPKNFFFQQKVIMKSSQFLTNFWKINAPKSLHTVGVGGGGWGEGPWNGQFHKGILPKSSAPGEIAPYWQGQAGA
jgi:hypothetical protein